MKGSPPADDDARLAALLAVLALVRQDGAAAGPSATASAVRTLGHWRLQRMAALARTRPEPESVRPSRLATITRR